MSKKTNQTDNIRKVVIVGGGSAGWMAAASLSSFLDMSKTTVQLIESEAIGTIGVGEATLPNIKEFNESIGVDEKDFMKNTNATYKLGIEFSNWARKGDRYFHPFGQYGQNTDGLDFLQFWIKFQAMGEAAPLSEYSLACAAAKENRFDYPNPDLRSILSTYTYGYHIDATLYARYLRTLSEKNGVERIEGKVVAVNQRDTDGFVTSAVMEDGTEIDGELFIDCTGFRGLLIGDAMGSPFEDWLEHLPCDRAVAIQSENDGDVYPYTKSKARDAGWTWHIPLQNRVGNGHVYSSKYSSDDEALHILEKNLRGKAITEPLQLKFKAGRRDKSWVKNVIAIGLASGFVEPLESTALHMIQNAIRYLAEHFPDRKFCEHEIKQYNDRLNSQYDWYKDFIILHYHATERDDTKFWRYVKDMEIPESLQHKMNLYKSRGYIIEKPFHFFPPVSWTAVYTGQRIIPEGYNPRVDIYPEDQVKALMNDIKTLIAKGVGHIPKHEDTLNKYFGEEKNQEAAKDQRFSSMDFKF